MDKEFRTHRSTGLLVSNDGEVMWTTTYNTGHQHTYRTYGWDDGKGYRKVKCEGKNYFVHRLVAECFIPNPEEKTDVDHINTNCSDNRVENLRWTNHPFYGEHHSEETKRKMSKSHKGIKQSEETLQKIAEANKKPIIGTHKTTGEIVEFESAKDAWLTLKINQANITQCCQGKRKSAGDYEWRYKRENDETTLKLHIPLIINLKKAPEILRNVKMP